MQTKGRLIRCFPGPAVAIDSNTMLDPSFRVAIAQLLTQLDAQTPEESWPTVMKAKTDTIEIRDAIHPRFVTEMLTGILQGIGNPVEVSRIYKRTRDDILWDYTLKPWRRSPLWLLLRVGLQTTLIEDGEDCDQRYKSFMIFFMARILERALQKSLPSDLFFIMAAKISRRTLKLAVSDPGLDMDYVNGVVEATHREIDRRWRTIEQNPDPLGVVRAWESSELSFSRDTRLTILNLRPYLKSIYNRIDQGLADITFSPHCPLRISRHSTEFPCLTRLNLNSDFTTRLALKDLEAWVRDHLDSWLHTNLKSSESYIVLARMIREYTTVAISLYKKNPESISLMLLTAMELWMALDKCVTLRYPLLAKYEPGFFSSLYEPLLLPTRLQMERLACVERYIQKRIRESSHNSSYIFQNVNASESFNVQYLESSLHHQELKRKIEIAATNERQRKKNELEQKRKEHQHLMQESQQLGHTEVTRWNGHYEYSTHDRSCCRKCQFKDQADGLQITVHEWPLPYDELEAKSAVFELDVPRAIAEWREATYTLLVDIFSPEYSSSAPKCGKIYPLREFADLNRYLITETGRFQFASEAKPFVVSHYGSKTIPLATEDNICVKNGLQYAVHDIPKNQWTKDLLGYCDVQEMCTLQLPSGAYKSLQYAVHGTTHTSNDILARQSQCPRGLNLHEFYAFATLRSGHRLQWRNLARELTAHTLNFGHEETYLLVVQAAWQAGVGDTGSCRESHADLQEEDFGNSLLSVLTEALETVEGNWQGAAALRTFVALATRLLSVSAHRTVHERCYLYLKRARIVALQWARDVGGLLHEEEDVEQLNLLNLRLLEMALTCHGTFDVDESHIPALINSSEDIAIVIECCIIIHDRCPVIIQQLPQPLERLQRRYERLSHFLESPSRGQILQDRAGIDNTIRRVWSAYRPGCPWTALDKPNERWLTTETSSKGDCTSVTVHYNLLDGSLLVNASPLTRLPQDYELHGTYQRLFGKVNGFPPLMGSTYELIAALESLRSWPIHDGGNEI
jgi:hypothetical protein